MELTADDVRFETCRSGGPGGQHANRRNTAVRLRVKISELPLSDEQKRFLKEHLPPRRLVQDEELIVENANFRSQKQNRNRALKIAAQEIEKALEKGSQAKKRAKRTRRIKHRKKGGGGGTEDIRETEKKRHRSETTDDLLEQAYEEAPELIKPFLEQPDK